MGSPPKFSTTDLKVILMSKLYCCLIEKLTISMTNVIKTLCRNQINPASLNVQKCKNKMKVTNEDPGS